MSAEVERSDAVHAEIVEDMSADEAHEFVKFIRAAQHEIPYRIADAYHRRAWVALGYQSWHEMCVGEGMQIRPPRDERSALVLELRAAGLSTRAIASATGAAQDTVRRDLQGGERNRSPEPADDEWTDAKEADWLPASEPEPAPEPAPEPTPITGRDGKTYKPSKPVQGERDDSLTEEQQRERDAEQAIERAQRRLQDLVSAWPQLESLPEHHWRDRILAGLTDPDRERIEAIERRRAASDFATRNETCEAAEWLAREMRSRDALVMGDLDLPEADAA